MVKQVTLFVEGGVLPSDNIDTATMDNSQLLREAFHQLFSELGVADVDMQVDICGPNKSAFKRFIRASAPNKFLLVDLDAEESGKDAWFAKMSKEILPTATDITQQEIDSQKDHIYFMIQAMEAWIVSQPEAIERWAQQSNYVRVKADKAIKEDNNLTGRHPMQIVHPETALKVIVARYFEYNGKKVVYGKLRSAPSLLKQLNKPQLKNDFLDLDRLMGMLQP